MLVFVPARFSGALSCPFDLLAILNDFMPILISFISLARFQARSNFGHASMLVFVPARFSGALSCPFDLLAILNDFMPILISFISLARFQARSNF